MQFSTMDHFEKIMTPIKSDTYFVVRKKQKKNVYIYLHDYYQMKLQS
uniref:Uncharacterized protein n=1 Tax=Rhizophora mucronata TaxID=61149 RepID=A0A2P2NTU3_RHIMU